MADIGTYKDKVGRTLGQARAARTTLAGAASNGTTEVVLVAAPGAGKRLRVFSVFAGSLDDAGQLLNIKDGASGTVIGKFVVPTAALGTPAANIGGPLLQVNFQGGIMLSENKGLVFTIGEASIATVYVSAEYVTEDLGVN